MLLCDYAEELGGKLYIMGGGWSVLQTPNVPSNVYIAIKLAVPWSQANEQHDIAIRLLTEDGELVHSEGPEGKNDVQLVGKVEVGRPPGLRPGTSLDLPLVAGFQGLVLLPGGYLWSLEIDETPLATTPFRVREMQ